MKFFVFVHFVLIQAVLSRRLNPECQIKVISFVYSEDTHDGYISWEQVSPECTTSPYYVINYKIADSEELTTSALPNTQMGSIPLQSVTCEGVKAKITVSVGGVIEGESVWTEMVRELKEVKGLEATQTAEGVVVAWEPINLGENCPETYLIQYKIDSLVIESKNSTDPNILIELTDDSPCTNVEIQVITNINGYSSKSAKITYEIKIPPPENVALSNYKGKVLVDFDRIKTVPSKCGDFDYRVTYEDLGCFNTSIEVLPMSKSGTEGILVTKEIVRQPGVVQNPLIVVEDDQIVLSWSPPRGGEDCDMVYLVEIDQKISSTPLTTLKKNLELESCVEGKIAKITPVIIYNQFDDVQGIEVDLPIIAELKEVSDLICELDSILFKVTCSWKKPEKSDNCEKISYNLSYYNGEENQKLIEDTKFDFELAQKEFCAIWFLVEPIAVFNGKEYRGKIKQAEIEGCYIKKLNKNKIK